MLTVLRGSTPVLATVAAAAVAAVALVLVAAPPPAAAHAVLTSTSPAAGEALDVAPDQVALTFNEPVGTSENALRVFDQDGQRVDDGLVETDDRAQVAVALPDGLGDGAYVVAYRVVSDDSHPVAGVLTFTVGDATALDAATVEQIAGVGAGGLGVVGSVLRGLGYAGTLLAAGAIVFVLTVGRSADDRRRAARLAVPAALGGIAVTVLHLPVQTAAVSGYGVFEVFTQPSAFADTFASGFGRSATVRIVALAVLAILWDRRAPDVALVAVGLPAVWSYLLDGHQRSVEPTWLLTVGDAVHLVFAAVWAAGLVLLVRSMRALRADDDPVGAAHVVTRFSRVALWSVVVLSVAGTAMAVPLVRGVDALTSTTYGWLLLAKVAAVAVVVALAAYNRARLVPAVAARAVPAGGSVDAAPDADRTAGSAAAWGQLSRTVRVEVALVAVVLGLTGFLVTTQPAAEAAGLTGPVYETVAFGEDLEIDLVVEPAATGLNTLHVYALEPGGQPTDQVDDLRLEFTYVPEGIGPITVEPFVAGPGHWTASIEDLRFAGEWEVRIVGGLGRFDEAEATVAFTIN
jgi:copper transport protein